jgi:hypothetical protein
MVLICDFICKISGHVPFLWHRRSVSIPFATRMMRSTFLKYIHNPVPLLWQPSMTGIVLLISERIRPGETNDLSKATHIISNIYN